MIKLKNKDYSFEMNVVGYEFNFNPQGNFYDNNWLQLKLSLKNCNTGEVVYSNTSAFMTSYELARLNKRLSRRSESLDFLMEEELIFYANNTPDGYVLNIQFPRYSDFIFSVTLSDSELDAFIQQVHELTVAYPIRKTQNHKPISLKTIKKAFKFLTSKNFKVISQKENNNIKVVYSKENFSYEFFYRQSEEKQWYFACVVKDNKDTFSITDKPLLGEQTYEWFLEEMQLAENDAHLQMYAISSYLWHLTHLEIYASEKVLWSYKPSLKQVAVYYLSIMVWPLAFFMLFSIVMALTHAANWNIVLFFGVICLITLIIALPAGMKQNKNLEYTITDKRIMKEMGVMLFEADKSNITKIKIKKSLFNKNNGAVKIYVKKGLSLNYHLEGITNIHEVSEILKTHYHEKIQSDK